MKTFVNARVLLPDGVIGHGYLTEENGVIREVGAMVEGQNPKGEIIDCQGKYLSPGFVDLHSHGGGGYDYMDGDLEDITGAARMHLSHGATSLLPTTLTSSDEELFRVIDVFKEAQKITDNMPHLLGLHLEGPYFSTAEKGAQDPRYISSPKSEHYQKIVEYADGAIRRWSIAPELPGAVEMAQWLTERGILVSAAHTSATLDEMKVAFRHGVRLLTHFYSAMSTIVRKNGVRVLGAVESGYLLDDMYIEIIADGMHLPPDLLKLILKCKDHDKIILCTDSMRAAGLPDGPSILGSRKGGQEVISEGGIALMPDRSCFAGSVATTDRLVRVMVYEAGLPVWKAVRMMSLTPAKLVGVGDTKGSLEAGKDADLVLFDDRITVHSVYVKGNKIH
ncbi:MAG: N-acetylglucosamine-6-phosphate deacetylase [Oscillospiraceae bacterium]|jgi:N-acetylglucosamine-6-phosphate deacetylase